MSARVAPHSELSLTTFARIASALSVTFGSIALSGWVLGARHLRQLHPFTNWMRASTASCFIVLGACFWRLLDAPAGQRWSRLVARTAAAAVAALGASTLFSYARGGHFGLEHYLVTDAPPGSMAAVTAANFVLFGLALVLFDVRVRWHRPSRWLAVAVAADSAVTLIGYLYGVTALSMSDDVRISPYASLLFLVLGTGMLAARPVASRIALLRGSGAGGVMLRSLLPAVIGLPVVLGWLRVVGQQMGLYESEFGTALITIATMGTLSMVVWSSARRLESLDDERMAAERARAESDRRYRQVAEAALDAVVVADEAGTITLVNRSAETIFGYSTEELMGRSLTALMPPSYRDAHLRGLRRYVETREARVIGTVIELRGRRKSGEEFPIEMSLSAVEHGGAVEFLGVIRDQTERSRMQAALLQSEKLASIGLLSAGIAHEINNPMSYVANNLHVLRRDTSALFEVLDAYEAGREAIAQAAPEVLARADAAAERADFAYVRANLDRLFSRTGEGIERVSRIVESLRSLARTERPQMTTADLRDVVSAGVAVARKRLQRHGGEVEVALSDDARVECIPALLSQAVLNLLTNAALAVEAAHPAGGGRVRVASRRAPGAMVIEVSDNGEGIAQENLPRLFDPFFTTRPVGEGTGLGLSITHSIVAAHRGRVEVESEPGVGATFRIVLPTSPRQGPAR